MGRSSRSHLSLGLGEIDETLDSAGDLGAARRYATRLERGGRACEIQTQRD